MEGELATWVMTAARFLIVVIAVTAGLLMIKYPTVEASLRINAVVAMVNVLLFSLINFVGIGALAGKVPVYKLGLVIAGSLMIIFGTMKPKANRMPLENES